MQERQLLTIEKIPVRLSLNSLTAAECLAHAARNYFFAGGRHPMRHPLMHQIDTNPDCKALAICADRVPLALAFFHYQQNDPERRKIVLHNFMVAPYVRRHGLASLLALHMMQQEAESNLADLSLTLDYPQSDPPPKFLSPLVTEMLGGSREWTLHGEALAAFRTTVEDELKTVTPKVLRQLITGPGFAKRLNRGGCAMAVLSDRNQFFAETSGQNWPSHVAVQAVHAGFHQSVSDKVEHYDLLLIDGEFLQENPGLNLRLASASPGLPQVVVGPAKGEPAPGVVMQAESPRLTKAIAPLLEAYRPEAAQVAGPALRSNLLGIPERESLVYYRNRHRSQRLFIVASGPSLAGVDPERFRKEITMTINDAVIRFPFTRYAAIMDARKLHELHMEVLGVDGLFTLRGNSYGTEIELLGTDGFSEDLEQGIYSGYTTAYFTLQLAVYMGFKEVYYLGLDLGNTAQQSHFFGNRPLQDRDRPEVYARMRQSFEQIAPRLAELNLGVYNCSPVSELKCFPYRPVDEVLARPPTW